MKFDFKEIDLTSIQIRGYSVLRHIQQKDLEAAEKEIKELLALAEEQGRNKIEFRDLFFNIANSF